MIQTVPNTQLQAVDVDCLTPPAWVDHLFATAPNCEAAFEGGLRIEVRESEHHSWLQIVLPGATCLTPSMLRDEVTRVYGVLRERLSDCRGRHPLRFWNYVPDIHRPSGDGMVRYEVFNAGRSAAFAQWYETGDFGPRMTAASGVGVRGEDFVVQLLAGSSPGRGVENPRQRPAWRYSKRYGPVPPSFARATLAPRCNGFVQDWMIVAGTASVVGEDSMHHGQFARQVDETCVNLRSLLDSAGTRRGLEAFEELRVYLVHEEHRTLLIDLLCARFPRLARLEIMPADICRDDLLVEVEGIVEFG